MKKLYNLLEAPIDAATIQKMIDSGKRVSIYYQGDDDISKGWKKVEPIRIDKEDNEDVLVAYDIESIAKKPEIKKFVQKKITNWNIMGTIPASFAAKEKEKKPEKEKPGQKKKIAIKKQVLDKDESTICDAIVNKRFVRFYYQGDKENSPGWRNDVQPVAYGIGYVHSVRGDSETNKNTEYIRAWQEKGKSVTGTPGWKMFRVDRIKNWSVENRSFDSAPEKFNDSGDGNIKNIKCIADFKADSSPTKGNALQESTILSAIKEAINLF